MVEGAAVAVGAELDNLDIVDSSAAAAADTVQPGGKDFGCSCFRLCYKVVVVAAGTASCCCNCCSCSGRFGEDICCLADDYCNRRHHRCRNGCCSDLYDDRCPGESYLKEQH